MLWAAQSIVPKGPRPGGGTGIASVPCLDRQADMLSTTPHTRAVRFSIAAGTLTPKRVIAREAEPRSRGVAFLDPAYRWMDVVDAILGCKRDLP